MAGQSRGGSGDGQARSCAAKREEQASVRVRTADTAGPQAKTSGELARTAIQEENRATGQETETMKRLIECVPNFSEGRDAAKVDAIVAAMSGVPGVHVLDREMDADHNRSVVTLAGEPDAVAEAALRGTGKAMELIDLTKHTGAHPRVGATDVLPFIPIEGVTIEDCVALARRVGEEIWKRFRIPVFFYQAPHPRTPRA